MLINIGTVHYLARVKSIVLYLKTKMTSYGHVTRHEALSKIILQGRVEGHMGRGRQKKYRMYIIKDRKGKKRIDHKNGR